ncbi:MAG: tripartite tricarboxylate transporter substrate binding protein [Burkholderiales bacterium]|nr:tripartite tricarboxylate transporter substrate binding protein [Burkholderiales bacterium]
MLAWLIPAYAGAQAYPSKTVRLVSPFAAGGSTDLLARIFAPKLNAAWKQPVIVENRAGAAGNTGADAVAKAAADGHTLLVCASNLAINPSLYTRMPFDTVRDLAPVALIGTAANVLIVHPSLPVQRVQDLVVLAKKRPGELQYGSGGSGVGSHIIAEMFKHAAGIDMVHIPYKGSGPALIGLLSGEVSVYFSNMVAAMSQVKAGRVRLVAVTSAERNKAIPATPTIAEGGIAGFEADNWYGMLTTGGAPANAVAAAHRDIQRAIQDEQITARLHELGITPAALSPEQFGRFIAAEMDKWRKAVQLAGARLD